MKKIPTNKNALLMETILFILLLNIKLVEFTRLLIFIIVEKTNKHASKIENVKKYTN